MTEKSIFLDTSVQVLRRFGLPKLKKELEKTIQSHDLIVSSTFARMEYSHSFLKDMIYLYGLTTRLNNFGEILYWLTRLPPVQRRKINRVIQCIASFYWEREGDISPDTLEKLQLWLPHAIDESWEWFETSLDVLMDETSCQKGKIAPERDADAYKPFGTCKKSEKKCNIDVFFDHHKSEFEDILKQLKEIPKEDKDEEQSRMEKIIERTLDHPDNLLDSKNCWKCGDAILSVECPLQSHLFSSNLKHFRLLLSCLKKSMLEEDKSSEEERQLIETEL